MGKSVISHDDEYDIIIKNVKSTDGQGVDAETIEDAIVQIINQFFHTHWRGAYLSSGEVSTEPDEIDKKYGKGGMRLRIAYHQKETGALGEFHFIPTCIRIKNKNSELMMQYELCEDCKECHVHLLRAESATYGDIKKASELARAMRRGIDKVYSSSGRPKQALYDRAYLMTMDESISRRSAFQWMNNEMRKENPESKGVTWATFKRTMKRRRNEYEQDS